MKRLLHRQEGAALVMALAFLLLSVPLVIAALKLASTLALDSGTGPAFSRASTPSWERASTSAIVWLTRTITRRIFP